MRKLTAIFITCLVTNVLGNRISDAYKALAMFDYFKAKHLFYKSYQKYPCEASFGLATIYYRSDNPFTNIDSAAKYISASQTSLKDSVTLSGYQINLHTINTLAQQIGFKGYQTYCHRHSISDLNHFLSHFYFSNDTLLAKSYYFRDKILLESSTSYQSSDSIWKFMLNHPESYLYQKALLTFYDFQYIENVPDNSSTQLKAFIRNHSKNPRVQEAEQSLFKLVQKLHSADSLYNFIKNYSSNSTRESAWKLLYSISVNTYSKEELTSFLKKYPEYPYNETLIREISLTQSILIPLKNTDDKYGYIDTLGNWMIEPQFDDALIFSEGYAVVAKNNFYFFIDKEGNKVSEFYSDEIENYKNGVAIVKKDNKSYLINRSGQIISKGFDDLNEISDNLFTARAEQVSGAINVKGETVIPFIYRSLGRFKRGFTDYGKYDSSDKFGLISTTNQCSPALWDWISAVDTNNMVIIRNNKKFGLLNVGSEIILQTDYDFITHCQNEIYLLVKNNLYGFYNIKDKCFITSVEYKYNSSLEPGAYTNGKNFKLIKDDDEVALVDANGRYNINYGTYDDFFFAKNEIIRIQKNNKYGFVDRKLKPVTPVEFDKATDFENNIAIVSKGPAYFLIDNSGKTLYSIKDGSISGMQDELFKAIPRSKNKLFLVYKNGLVGLLDSEGKHLLSAEFETVFFIYGDLYACLKNNELYIFNIKTKVLKKI